MCVCICILYVPIWLKFQGGDRNLRFEFMPRHFVMLMDLGQEFRAERKESMVVTAETLVEDLVDQYPKVAGWLSKRGLRCVVCGEPFWGSMGELAREDGLDEARLEELLEDLNEFVAGQDAEGGRQGGTYAPVYRMDKGK